MASISTGVFTQLGEMGRQEDLEQESIRMLPWSDAVWKAQGLPASPASEMLQVGVGGEQLFGAEHLAGALRLPDHLEGEQILGPHGA